MKYSIFFIILASAGANAQKIDVEARGNQVVIVERTTTPDGNPVEVATWRVDPQKYLADQLEETGRKVASLQRQISRLQKELIEQQKYKSDLEKALEKIKKGLAIETGFPDPETRATPKKSKPKSKN